MKLPTSKMSFLIYLQTANNGQPNEDIFKIEFQTPYQGLQCHQVQAWKMAGQNQLLGTKAAERIERLLHLE